MDSASPRRPWYRSLYAQVLIGVALGVSFGWLDPHRAAAMRPLGEGFINLVKMVIAPIIFCSVVHGIASMSDLRKLGRVGLKALLYFEIVSTAALLIGLVVVNVLKPGAGFNVDPHTLDTTMVKGYTQQAHDLSAVGFLLKLIPTTFFGALANGDLLQTLVISVLSGFAISGLGDHRAAVLSAIEIASAIFFRIMRFIVVLAPIGAFGAMAFTVGSYGVDSLKHLAALMLGVYLTSALFILGVLGSIARAAGFSIFRFLVWIREELLLVLGTSSSETALPGMLRRMQALGCRESTVGLVIPTGYSFNLDGTNIYMTMAAVFLAQATNTPLDLPHQLSLLAVAMLSSKGASGVTGAGFITLAATLAAVPGIPIESLALLLGIDRFMSESRSLTNLIGNGVATVVISRWEGEISAAELQQRLRGSDRRSSIAPEKV